MSEAKHTPGPWNPRFTRSGFPEVAAADGRTITDRIFNGDANARLIAAAPDLLAACRAAFNLLAERGDPFAGSDWELGHRLSAAIGKATDQNYPTTLHREDADR